MLRTLTIRDFVIVEHIELEFSAGFSVLTGETGAGKSILIDALSLTLGGRGDASMVREGANKADICAEFSSNKVCDAWLSEQELAMDEGMILLRRVIDNAGRSKAFINGVSATAAQLRELGALLVDIHGQHAHQSLLQNDTQRQLLDNHAQLTTQVHEVGGLYKNWNALRQQRTQFEANAKQVLLERERLEWQVSELDKLRTQADEWQEITNEHSRLAHAASLIEGAQYALNAISESEDPILSQIAAINQKLAKLTEYDEDLQAILDTLEPARIHLQEATSSLNDYLSRVELDPERLRIVEDRVEALHSCARKYHVTPEELPTLFKTLSTELAALGEATDLESLLAMEQAALKKYKTSATQLGKARAAAADKLGRAVTDAMQELSMVGGCFEVALTPIEPSLYGTEHIEYMVAGHAGVAARPLAKVASGGELARISLAISVITSSSTATPTLIFDEVDSGIGGGVAEVVGRLLKRLGQDYQVLCVTHLAQVASQADQHFQVSKTSQAEGTVSHIEMLDHKSRVEEIARMIGGLEITATTRKHARELLTT
ncbi:DNA repair protein RecN [Solimicrobium silvestre]|uniref:DNA repair protein RecN n=1 Tax=Solimicrobium silvestre TaxID=2099400 RepID=A0A2S9GTS0_9BURK|nr:DNA repair protein RecN [Solimicrobium silvestre]PRC91093.1 recN: DNA repair protein RecN [Solimicrobium silvestre]